MRDDCLGECKDCDLVWIGEKQMQEGFDHLIETKHSIRWSQTI